MSSFLSSSGEHDFVISIGSGSVCGAVVLLNKKSKPEIIHTHISDFPVKESVTPDVLAVHMLSALHSVATSLLKDHKRRVRVVHVVMASPWFSSFSKSLTVKKETPFIVQPKIVEKLINEQMTEIFKDLSKGDSVLIENAPSHIRLNGYETLEPYNKTAKTLDISVYASMAPKVLCEEIESEIYSVLHPHSIKFHTFPFVAWSVVNPLFSPREDFILIDVGSEVTDVLVARRGAIGSIVSFPIGKNHLVRKMAIHFGTHPELADSIINLYSENISEESVKEKAGSLVTAFAEEWGIRFQTALQEASKGTDHFVPQRAFFVTHQNVSKIFTEIIGKEVRNTTALVHDNLNQFVEFGRNEIPNIFIALATIYLNGKFADGHGGAISASKDKIVYKQEVKM